MLDQLGLKIIAFLSSVKLAVALFLSLALLSFIGSFLPQEPLLGRETLLTYYGEEGYTLIQSLGLHDVFRSWWLLGLFALLTVNLTLASFWKVFPKVARRGFRRPAAFIAHVGILCILLGAALNLLLGFNGIIQGTSGERFLLTSGSAAPRSHVLVRNAQLFHSPLWLGSAPTLEVELGTTAQQKHADGSPKQWWTELYFYQPRGNLLQKQKVAVNAPVHFRGIDFYQADWRQVLRLKFNETVYTLPLDPLAGQGVSFIPAGPNFGLLLLKPADANQLNIMAVNTPLDREFAPDSLPENLRLLASLRAGEEIQLNPAMRLKFLEVSPQSGIQYKYSPGDSLMILGMVILLCSFLQRGQPADANQSPALSSKH